MTASTLVSRESLYQELWSSPTVAVDKKYGISDSALAKICKKMDIPKPGRSYWARCKTGKQVVAIPLPAASDNTILDWEITPTPVKDPLPVSESEIPKVIVSSILKATHPIVSKTKDILLQGKWDGLTKCRPWLGALDIRISKSELPRALRILDAVLKTLEQRGHSIQIGGETEHYKTMAIINGETISFRLYEKEKFAGRDQRNNQIFIPIGNFQLENTQFLNRSPFPSIRINRKRKKVEDDLGLWILGLEATAQNIKQHQKLVIAWREV